MDAEKIKNRIVLAGKEMCDKGLTSGTAGNISMRIDDRSFAITPTNMNYYDLTNDDIVVVDFEDKVISGKWNPSVEVTMHRQIFEHRKDVNAIIHTHPLYGTALATSKNIDELPAIDIEMVSYLGGSIGIAEFAPAGSKELADYVLESIGDRAGVLLKNHGAIGVGTSMESAFISCEILEKACYMFFLTQLLGGAVKLSDEFIKKGRSKYFSKIGINV